MSAMQQERSYKNYTAKWEFPVCNSDDENEDDENFVLHVSFYKDGNLLYTLKRNDYRTEHHKYLLLEYFEIDGQVVHLFNLKHSVISIINADTGVEVHHDKLYDTFIEDYKMFDDNEYMYISGWIWTPISTREIYHIPTFLKTPNYEPIYIECWNNSNIDLYGCATVKEFLEKKDKIRDKYYLGISTRKFNENRTKETLLRLFLTPNDCIKFKDDSVKGRLEYLLNTEQNEFHIKTYGMISGDHLARYDNVLYNVIKYDDSNTNQKPSRLDTLTFLCPKLLFHGYTKDLPIEICHLRFEIYGELDTKVTIYYKQELTWDNNPPRTHEPNVKRCMVDETKPCEIFIE